MLSQDDFSVAEIDWFLINCYNLAVKAAPAWPASAVISLFDIAIQVGNCPFWLCKVSDELFQITAHKTRFDPDLRNDASLEGDARRCLCHFAIAIICVAEGRRCPDIDSRVCMLSTYSKHDVLTERRSNIIAKLLHQPANLTKHTRCLSSMPRVSKVDNQTADSTTPTTPC
jgi:hypothetical protein